MNAQTMLNAKYEKLCQVLGDLEYRKSILDAQIKTVRQEITTLNSLVPEMNKIEKIIAANIESINKRGESGE